MATLRKGQGSDYYNYLDVYNAAIETGDVSFYLLFLKPDVLFYIICYILGSNGLEFMWFSAIMSLITMLLMLPFFTKICKNSSIALLIFYAYFFNSYFCSIMREGLGLSLIMGLGFPLLQRNKTLIFEIIVGIASLIHASALICLFFPLVFNLKISNKVFIILVCCLTIYSFISEIIIPYFPSFIKNRMMPYMEDKPFLVSFISRLSLLVPIFILKNKVYMTNGLLREYRNLTIFGYLIYCLLSFGFIIASRTAVYYLIFICALMPGIIFHSRKKANQKLCLLYSGIICTILFAKDINGYISQGNYRNCNFLTYPYLSVFDDNETINYYRQHLGFSDKSVQ